MSIFSVFKYVTDIPAGIELWNDVQALLNEFSEKNIDELILDAKPLVKKYCPNIPDSELDSVTIALLAIAAIKTNRSPQTIGTALASIVNTLPEFGIPINQEHAVAFIQSGVNLLADAGIK